MTEHLEVRRGAYADSVSLMQVSRRVGEVDGVDQALVAMATELNLQLLAGMGFDAVDAGPNDLVVALRGRDETAIEAALAELQAALAASRGGGAAGGSFGDGPPPRTVRDAAARLGTADERAGELALVSTPGEHAYLEALDALRAGLHVMVFSDNVPVDAEVALKREAGERGLLVMGPDAGTAIVAGVGLGFANVVQPGPVGIVAASGTGAQHLTCLLDDAGIGVSHVLGVGGRDLTAAVGGASTLQALRALDADPATETIVVLSKPPDEAVGARVRVAAEACATPVVFAMLGPGQGDLTGAAGEVARARGATFDEPRWWPAPQERQGTYTELRGLFAGGTLCQEATLVAADALGEVASNVTLPGTTPLTDGLDTPGHLAVDLGEDEYTLGRPHPMIDQSLRIERIAAEAARPGGRVLLLDVVLGHGAHPDPAGELAPAIEAAIATGEDLAVVVSLCGSAGDPQGRDRQAEALVAAGASVHLSNAAAAAKAIELVGGRP
jgi:FdrA protein